MGTQQKPNEKNIEVFNVKGYLSIGMKNMFTFHTIVSEMISTTHYVEDTTIPFNTQVEYNLTFRGLAHKFFKTHMYVKEAKKYIFILRLTEPKKAAVTFGGYVISGDGDTLTIALSSGLIIAVPKKKKKLGKKVKIKKEFRDENNLHSDGVYTIIMEMNGGKIKIRPFKFVNNYNDLVIPKNQVKRFKRSKPRCPNCDHVWNGIECKICSFDIAYDFNW